MNFDLSRQWFAERGALISVWASENGFSRDLVYSVLLGRVKGKSGEAFEIRKKLLELAEAQAASAKNSPHEQAECNVRHQKDLLSSAHEQGPARSKNNRGKPIA
ncbi:hypothetical protein [Acidovorax sp. Root217]|uniref:hypothetical protein n=1 Tax=Acidovorax sp. Root217 TaxID=1736492 RepID=UPI0009E7B2D1|nr:hypothetical protein [Acidovorax sp. Root217]